MAWLDGTSTPRTQEQQESKLRFIVNANASAAFTVTQTGNASASTSTGGAVNINNSGSTGAGLVIYSAQAAPAGRLLVVRADHATFSQSAAIIQTAGTGHALHADVTATNNATSSAINATSANTGNSCAFFSGVETSRATIKVTHTGTGTDANAAGLSIDLAGAGTAAQGIFIDATGGGTTGDLMDLRNAGAQLFKVKTNGYLAFGNGGPGIAWGPVAPEGVVTAPAGWIYLRSAGSGSGQAVYRKETGSGNTGWVSESQMTATTQATGRTLTLADAGTVIETTSSSGITLTVPLNSAVAFPVGTVIEICQYGTGQVTLSPSGGVALRPPVGSALTTRVQYSTVSLRKRSTDEWIVSGDLS